MLTPDVVETGFGKLTFNNSAPTPETANTVTDFPIFTNGLNVYNNSFRGASACVLQKGFQSIGAEDITIIIFSELMEAKSLFLTVKRGYRLLPRGLRSEQGADGERTAAEERRHHQ
jgi:hypothetical protein